MLKKILTWFKEDFFKKLIKNSITLVTGNVGASIIGSISMIISIKVLGVAGFGIFTVVQTYFNIFDSLLNFQSWEALINFGSKAKSENNTELLKSYIKQGFILDISSAVLGTIVSYVSIGFLGKWFNWDQNVITLTRLFCLIIVFNIAGTPIGILRLFRKFKIFSIQKLVSALIKLVGVIIAFVFNGDLLFFVIASMVTQVVGYILLILMGLKTLKDNSITGVFKAPYLNSKEFTKFLFLSNINSALTIPIREVGKIIASLISYEAAGVYKLFKQIISIIGKVVTPIYQTLYPELAQFISNGQFKKAVSVSKKIGVIMLGVGSIFLVVLAPTSVIWLKWIIDIQSLHYCFVLSLFLIIQVLSNAFIAVNPLFISAGYIKYNFFIILFVNLIYLVVAYILTLNYGLIGLVIATFVEVFLTYSVKVFILSQDKRIKKSKC